MFDKFEKHLYKTVFPMRPPENIFHFTTQAGILGIIQSLEMWATQVHFLNDKHEIFLTFKLLEKELKRRIGSAQTPALRSLLVDIRSNLKRIDQSHICIASFCERGDLLSQWRGYGNQGKGYAIGFDLGTLRQIAKQQHFVLWPCVYSVSLQLELVEYLIESWLKEFCDGKTSHEKMRKIIDISTGQLAPILKDENFSEEKEWRLVSSVLTSKSPGFAFREGQYSLIPYYKFSITNKDGKNGIKSIVVGPSPHQELARNSLTTFLNTQKLSRVEIKSSKIPFRHWK
ncbi:MAG: DUF2971 domain-containing protein [Candidatus Riflebacteria bacterium]|nr:DUF2971 domain-containing protein [Candidatus Riflebacteria bacterium]